MDHSSVHQALAIPELLSQIILSVQSPDKGSTADPYNLLFVNKAFQTACLPVLYSHASCANGRDFGSYAVWSKEKEAKFKATIENSVDLAKQVKSLQYRMDVPTQDSWFRLLGGFPSSEGVLHLLKLCHNIRIVSIYLPHFRFLLDVGNSAGDRLRHLELVGLDCDDLLCVKEAAGKFPAVTSLVLIDWQWEAVSTFAAVIGSRLKSLCIVKSEDVRSSRRRRRQNTRMEDSEWISLFERHTT